MTDTIKLCDIIEDCTQCRLYGWECDGRPEEEDDVLRKDDSH